MSDLRWMVTEYNLGPFYTKEAAIAEAVAFQQTKAAGALLYQNKKPKLLQVRPKTVDDVPESLVKTLLDVVYEFMEDYPRLAGFEAFDREVVGFGPESKLRDAILTAYKAGIVLTDESAWVPTGVEATLFSADAWKF